jgi:hypothetical protein
MPTKLLFAGDFYYFCGSTHVVFNYSRIAKEFDCELRLSTEYGRRDSIVEDTFSLCSDASWADHVIFIFETEPYLKDEQLREIQRRFPRRQMTIIDTDGRFGPTVSSQGDSNHQGYLPSFWNDLYCALTDRILQPRLRRLSAQTLFFPFYGMEYLPRPSGNWGEKRYTIRYVGNNWYRWPNIRSFFSGLAPIRASLGRIALTGRWWGAETAPGFEAGTFSESKFLNDLGIEIEASVPFGEVIPAMGEALISPLFVRSMLAAQQALTPRMFEVLCANTIPVFGQENEYLATLYGPESFRLCYGENPAELIQRIHANPLSYYDLVLAMREHLYARYNYRALFARFLEIITNPAPPAEPGNVP